MELDRYDRLSEEVETVQQRCEGLLEAQQQEHQWELRAREQARTWRLLLPLKNWQEIWWQSKRMYIDSLVNEYLFWVCRDVRC